MADLEAGGELTGADRALLERVAVLVSPYALVGWDTGGEEWTPMFAGGAPARDVASPDGRAAARNPSPNLVVRTISAAVHPSNEVTLDRGTIPRTSDRRRAEVLTGFLSGFPLA